MNRKINESLDFHKLRPPVIRYLDNKGNILDENAYPEPEGKKAMIVRYGAIGDMIFVSHLPRLLKEQGYYVVLNTQDTGAKIMMHNPYIDEVWFQDRDVIANQHLGEYWEKLSEGFDRFINLSQSIERRMCVCANNNVTEEYPEWVNRRDENYYDITMELAGFPEQKGLNGELYFTEQEEERAALFIEDFKDNFKVMIVPAGSAFSKAWPWWDIVFNDEGVYQKAPEMVTISLGDDWGRLLDWEHKRHYNGCGKLTLRESLLLTKHADLVIGPDTGVINAAGSFGVPTICLLGQTSINNISKNWKNNYSVQSPSECSPCYRIIYDRDHCPLGKHSSNCVCMEELKPHLVIRQIKKVYDTWKYMKGFRIVTPEEHRREPQQCQQLPTL